MKEQQVSTIGFKQHLGEPGQADDRGQVVGGDQQADPGDDSPEHDGQAGAQADRIEQARDAQALGHRVELEALDAPAHEAPGEDREQRADAQDEREHERAGGELDDPVDEVRRGLKGALNGLRLSHRLDLLLSSSRRWRPARSPD